MQFLISIHKADRALDYSALEAFLDGQDSRNPLLADQHIVLSEIGSCQILRDQLQKFLHPGDSCSVAEVVDCVFHASSGLPR